MGDSGSGSGILLVTEISFSSDMNNPGSWVISGDYVGSCRVVLINKTKKKKKKKKT
jgi:hypothetical protein